MRGAILRLLAERPMHGYELIGELEERTGGRWRPSPGSVYPTLAQLEDEGLVRPVVDEADDRKRFELTDAGREWLTEHPESDGPPWAGGRGEGFGGPGGFGGRGELRRLGGEIFGQLRQLARFGSPRPAGPGQGDPDPYPQRAVRRPGPTSGRGRHDRPRRLKESRSQLGLSR